MDLPKSLYCLTVEHNLDDPDTIEQLFVLDPRTAECMPVALRNVMNQYAIPAGMPSMAIPDAKTLLDYLTIIWTKYRAQDELLSSVDQGVKYLLPYAIARYKEQPYGENNYRILAACSLVNRAIIHNRPEMLELLLFPPMAENSEPAWPAAEVYAVNPQALSHIAKRNDVAMMNMLIRAGLTEDSIIASTQSFPDTIYFLRQFIDQSVEWGLKTI